jgi:hypothetical protein
VGVFTGLLTLPLAPVRGVAWIGEQLLEQATREASDPAQIQQRLVQLDAARAAGDISEQDCAAAEDQLVAELMQARESRGAGVWP